MDNQNIEFDNNKYEKIIINEYFKEVDTLVICGGGIAGLSFIQAIHIINDKTKFLEKVTSYAGTSVGSILCYLLLLRIKTEDILDIIEYSLFGDIFVDNIFNKLYSLYNNFGMLDGNILLNKFIDYFDKSEKFNHYGIKMKDILKKNMLEFINDIDEKYKCKHNFFVVGTNISLQKSQIFSKITTPRVKLRDCLLASTACIPYIASHKIKICDIIDNYPNENDTHVFIDGGVTINFPINIFINPESVFKNIEYEQNKYIYGENSNNNDITGINDEKMNQIIKTLPALKTNYKNIYGLHICNTVNKNVSWLNLLIKIITTNINMLDIDNDTINRINVINVENTDAFDFNNKKLVPLLKKYGTNMVEKYFGDKLLKKYGTNMVEKYFDDLC